MYNWLIGLVGELPQDANTAQIVAYCCACVVTLVVVISILKLLLLIYKSIFRFHL